MKQHLSLLFLILMLLCSCTPELDVIDITSGTGTEDISDLNTIIFSSSSGSTVVSISASREWKVTTKENEAPAWLSFSPYAGNKGDAEITISVQQNDSYQERTATLVFTCGEVSQQIVVIQREPMAIITSHDSYELFYDSTSLEIDLSSNVDITSIETSVDWINLVTSKSFNERSLLFHIEKNVTKEPREALIKLSSQNLTKIIHVTQLATTHSPISEIDLENSYQMLTSIGKGIDAIIGSADISNSLYDKDDFLKGVLEIDNVIDAFENSTGTGIVIQQRDSVYFNYVFDSWDYNVDQSGRMLHDVQDDVSARQNSTAIGKKALLLLSAQGYESYYPDIITYLCDNFDDAGISYSDNSILSGEEATLEKFLGTNMDDNDLVFIIAHGADVHYSYDTNMESQKEKESFAFVTGEEYSAKKISYYLDKGIVKREQLAYVYDNSKAYLALPFEGLNEADFNDSCIIACSCMSAMPINGYPTFMNAFIARGAGGYAGFDDSIQNKVGFFIAKRIVNLLSHGISLQDAVSYIKRDHTTALCSESYKNYYRYYWGQDNFIQRNWATGRNDNINYCDYNHLTYKVKSSFISGGYYLTEPPQILVNISEVSENKEVIFNWNCQWEDFDDKLSFTNYQENFEDRYEETKRYRVLYKAYVDNNLIYEGRLSSTKWTPSSYGDHYLRVEAIITDGDNLVAECSSGEKKFMCDIPYIKLDAQSVDVGYEGGTLSVMVESNVSVSVRIAETDWIKLSSISTDGKKYTFNVMNNTEMYDRRGQIVFYNNADNLSNEFTVHQKGVDYPSDWSSRDFWRRSFVLYFAKQGCSPAVREYEELRTLKSRYNDKVEILSVYANDRYPIPSVYYSPALEKKYEVTYIPCTVFNGKDYGGPSATSMDKYRSMIRQNDSGKANTGIGFASTLSGNRIDVDVSLLVKKKGKYSVMVFLMEDNVIAFQLGAPDEDNFRHDHVARVALSTDTGDKFTTTQNNVVQKFSYSAIIPSSVNKRNLRVIVATFVEYGSYSVTVSNGINEHFYGSYVDNVASEKAGVRHKVDFIDNRDGSNENIGKGGDIDFD